MGKQKKTKTTVSLKAVGELVTTSEPPGGGGGDSGGSLGWGRTKTSHKGKEGVNSSQF